MDVSPLVSVVIPVYNRPYVTTTIKSIVEQTYKNLEIVVIDNASTDNTVFEINKIKDSRIKLLVNERNMGQTYSLNRGLTEATGTYIARIDSDDIAFPERIEKQVNFLEDHPDYVLVGSWVQFISDNDRLGMVVKMPTTYEGMCLMQTISCGMYHPTAMYRRDIIIQHGIKYDENYHMAEDYDLWVQLMRFGKALNLSEPLIYYRRGDSNDSSIHRQTMTSESRKIRKIVCSELQCDELKKEKILLEIDKEAKQKKSIKDCIDIYRFYRDYLIENISSDSKDYLILWQHFMIRIYGSCFASSEAWYAPVVRWIYNNLKRIKNRQRGKLS